MFDKYAMLVGEERAKYGKSELSFFNRDTGKLEHQNIELLYSKYSGMTLGRDYDAFSSSLLQKTLDFGNSGATVFNKDWYYDMIAKTGMDEMTEEIPNTYKYFVSELSKGYKNLKFDTFKI